MEERQKLYDFFQLVVDKEMDDTQKDIFSLEGKEVVEKFLHAPSEAAFVQQTQSQGLDFGFSPEMVSTLTKSFVELGTFALSCLTVYLNYKKDKERKKADALQSVEEELKAALEKHQISALQAAELSKKYAEKFKETIQ